MKTINARRSFIAILLFAINYHAFSQTDWTLTGNGNITTTSFLGTTNYQPITFKVSNATHMQLYPYGNLQLGGFPTIADNWFKLDVTGRTALRTTETTANNQNNILSIYSNNQSTSSYIAGSRHYMAFSHVTYPDNPNLEIGVINVFDFNKTTNVGVGKHLLLQNTIEGNLGIGVFTTAPDAKLTVNGFSKFTASYTGGGDVARFVNPVKTGTGRDHYLYLANRAFDGNTSLLYGAIGAYESTPGSTTAEGPKHLLIQEQFNSGGNVGIGYHRTAPIAKLSVNGSTIMNGTVCVGDTYVPTGFQMSVNGKLVATEVHVKSRTKWPDFVFDKNYKLIPLDSVSEFIEVNKHLPGVPSAIAVEQKGISLGEMDAILLQKVEELTLYTIEQQKLIRQQVEANAKLFKMLEQQNDLIKLQGEKIKELQNKK